jgi:hypothetical protein
MALPGDEVDKSPREPSDEVPLRWTFNSAREEWVGLAVDTGEVLLVIAVEDVYAMRGHGGTFPTTARRPRLRE